MGSVTVGICAYNEAWNMRNLLNNVTSEQQLPDDSEVLVVASGCMDETPAIVREFASHDSRVKLIEEPVRVGKASAVNIILDRAAGDQIVFLSADVVPRPNCIPALLSAMRISTVGIACGRPVPVQRGRKLVREIVQTLWGFHNWQLEKLNDAGLLMHASEVFLIRRGIVREIPKDMVNDDAYLAVATKRRGYSIVYVPRSEVQVFGPQTVADYLRQRRRILAGHYQVREETGHFSQLLFYSALVRPRITFRLITEYFASHHKITGAMAAGLIEVIAHALAALDVISGRSHAIWSISATTKTAREI